MPRELDREDHLDLLEPILALNCFFNRPSWNHNDYCSLRSTTWKKLSKFFSLCSAHCEPICSISTLVCGYAIGGNFLNIFSIALLSFWAVFSGLSGIVPVAVPRQITCLVLVSNKSTMS